MGNVIRYNASAEDIFADVRVSLAACRERGGVWKIEGEDHLADILRLGTAAQTAATTADDALEGLKVHRDLLLDQAHQLVGEGYDRVWNAIGRPRHDVWLVLLYPSAGSTAYGPIGDRAGDMVALADLLETVGHPRVPGPVTTALAVDLRTSAATLDSAVTGYTVGKARSARCGTTVVALAKVAQHQLALLKRVMAGKGFREPEIHAVIPDRGKSSAEPAVPPAAEPPVEPPAS